MDLSVPSGCERVGLFYILCPEGGSPTNHKDNINGSHNLAQKRVSAVPYEHSTITIPLHDAMPAIGNRTNSTGINRTRGSTGVTIGFFVFLFLSIVLSFIAVWLFLRRTKKLRDEEKAIEMRPRPDQYQSASKLRLKEKVRGASRPNKVVQNSRDGFVDDVNLPRGADASIDSATVAASLDRYP